MSYNLIFTLLLVMLPINALIVFFAYRQGLKDGKVVKEDKVFEPVVNIPKKKPELTEEQKRLSVLLENVNSYKGNAIGQREVK